MSIYSYRNESIGLENTAFNVSDNEVRNIVGRSFLNIRQYTFRVDWTTNIAYYIHSISV